ncbi:uncharacterized protein [Rutidosis leptorrhynchoides]|uniref:uncharacterized protein n=1 Tax=Rutidosis leptorrhynchoides TaxID=125765 RepID=UPI003A99C204
MKKNRSSFCPGFRFHPTDTELAMYYLKRKLLGKNLVPEVIADVKIYDFHPRDLPDKSNLRNGDLEWFFFCPKSKKYANGSRTNRATETGYWKATGKDREVKYKDKTVAWIKTLVFHLGRPPKGERSDWVMHEYRMEDKDLADAGIVQDAYVICKLFEKSGVGPKNGAQYGAPFEEEDWDDDDDDDETVLLNANSSNFSNMTQTDPAPFTAESSENVMEEIFAAPPLAFGATSTPVPFASTFAEPGLCTAVFSEPGPCNAVFSESGPCTAVLPETEGHFETSELFGSCNASEGLDLYASISTVMNMTAVEPGSSTQTPVPYASGSDNACHHLRNNDDDHMHRMLTDADVASILQNSNTMFTDADVALMLQSDNTKDAETDPRGNKVMTDAPNDDEVLHFDPGDCLLLDDLSQDGFNMFQDAATSSDFAFDPFPADYFDADELF